jgi:hypothetical protein
MFGEVSSRLLQIYDVATAWDDLDWAASQSCRSERLWSKSGRDGAFSVNGVGINGAPFR